jgi:hypothetical protein
MMTYENEIAVELKAWQINMNRKPSFIDRLSKKAQAKMNSIIPEKIHHVITQTIKAMVRGVLFGAKYTTPKTQTFKTLLETEQVVDKRILMYKNTAAAEGGITGAGGILLGLADFPILLSIKLKMLFDIAALYGFNVQDYKERLYILHIFELAFSSQSHRQNVYREMMDWDRKKEQLPDDVHKFNWRSFQQEYRDYIDLAKMAQLIPGIGAVVGYIVNKKLIEKLGDTAKNAYRMRILARSLPSNTNQQTLRF